MARVRVESGALSTVRIAQSGMPPKWVVFRWGLGFLFRVRDLRLGFRFSVCFIFEVYRQAFHVLLVGVNTT